MSASPDEPRFIIRDAVALGSQCFVTWDFVFRMMRFSRNGQCTRGTSHLLLAEDGRTQDHRDCWDAAEKQYEKPPRVGALMRWSRRRANGWRNCRRSGRVIDSPAAPSNLGVAQRSVEA